MDGVMWGVLPEFIKGYLEKLENATEEETSLAASLFSDDDDDENVNPILSFSDDKALIDVSGPLRQKRPSFLARFFGFGGTSYADIIDGIEQAVKAENVSTIVLQMLTPGGEIHGVDAVFQTIMEAKKTKKIIAENHGLIASSGYWIASACDEIIALSPADETGCIGAVFTTIDFSKAAEKEGIKKIVITSKNAPNKALDLTKQKDRNIMRERLNAVERVFLSRISEGRNVSVEKIINDFGKGSLLIAEDPDPDKPDAISVGMIDCLSAKCGNKKSRSKSFVGESGDDQIEGIEKDTLTGDISKNSIKSSLVDSDKIKNIDAEEVEKNNNFKGDKTMSDLIKLMSENPGLKAEIEARDQENFKRGEQSGKDKVEARVKSASKFVGGDYPKQIQALATKVILGESEIAALEGAVTMYDIQTEGENSTTAAAETEETPETPAEGNESLVAEDGTVTTETDQQDTVKRMKKMQGMEV